MNKEKFLLLSITTKDFRWDYFCSGGSGGQRRDKKATACRCVHEPSGAIGTSQDERQQSQNKLLAFRRCAEHLKMARWLKIEAARRLSDVPPEIMAQAVVDSLMGRNEDFKLEVQDSHGNWKEISLEEFLLVS